jgi:AraC family transcriptional regulator
MQHRIVYLEAFSVIGVKEFTSFENGENFIKVPQMWSRLPAETMTKLQALSDLQPSGVLGVCANMRDGGFDYWIAAASTKECPAGFEKLDIPAAQWTVFEVVGAMPKAIQDGVKYIFIERRPSSDYRHAGAPRPGVVLGGRYEFTRIQE